MLIDQRKNHKREFLLARATEKAAEVCLRSAYRKNLEKALIVSLCLIIILLRLCPRLEFVFPRSDASKITIEVVEIPVVETEEPPLPPPAPKVEEPEVNEPEKIIANIIDVMEDDVNLSLPITEKKEDLLVDSQTAILEVAKSVSRRVFRGDASSLSLEVTTPKPNYVDESSLSLNPQKTNLRDKVETPEADLDLDVSGNLNELPEDQSDKFSEPRDFLDRNLAQILVRPSRSSIGLEEYRLWNKLAAELDKLNKGRYGENHPNVIRRSDGLTVSLRYGNGIQHEITWQKGGKTWIKVIGKNSVDPLEELQRALNGLLGLTVN